MVGLHDHHNFKLTAMFTKFILAVMLLSFSLVSNGNTTCKGKWKLINAGKTLFLYAVTLYSYPKQLVGDEHLPFIKLTATEFVTNKLLFAMDMKGTSYYKKQ